MFPSKLVAWFIMHLALSLHTTSSTTLYCPCTLCVATEQEGVAAFSCDHALQTHLGAVQQRIAAVTAIGIK